MVTVTVEVPLLVGKEAGLTAHVVPAAGSEQVRLTVEVKPFICPIEMEFENEAVCPAVTVWVMKPIAFIEKSVAGVMVKLAAADVPPGEGSTT